MSTPWTTTLSHSVIGRAVTEGKAVRWSILRDGRFAASSG
jgi:hypothetical protein